MSDEKDRQVEAYRQERNKVHADGSHGWWVFFTAAALTGGATLLAVLSQLAQNVH